MKFQPGSALMASFCVLTLTGCASTPEPSPQAAFWDALSTHCGKAYVGTLVSEDARDADWAGRRMIAHWADCDADRIAIALHVEEEGGSGWNRSRTWLVSPAPGGLHLKHDHRHEDGEEDRVTQYGGETIDEGTSRSQDFPVDAYSIALFEREGLSASLTNVWRIEVDPAGAQDGRLVYQLTRRNDPSRLFRVEFDLTQPVAPPPAAWGW